MIYLVGICWNEEVHGFQLLTIITTMTIDWGSESVAGRLIRWSCEASSGYLNLASSFHYSFSSSFFFQTRKTDFYHRLSFLSLPCPCHCTFSSTSDVSNSCSLAPLRENNGTNHIDTAGNGNGNNNNNDNNGNLSRATTNTNPRRRRQPSAPNYPDRTLVEIGGVTPSQPHGTDRVSFYCLRNDLTVVPTEAYIKLPQQMRYLNCAVHSVGFFLKKIGDYRSAVYL